MEKEQGQPMEFAGKVAVVTGGARGIGRTIACELSARGACIILVDRDAQAAAEALACMQRPGRAPVNFLLADLAAPEAIAALAARILALGDGIQVDVLINNAGIELDQPFGNITAGDFDRVLAVNLRAPLLVAQALIPLFPASGGAIVNISSIHASHAFMNALPYACSKAGMLALTRNMALELASKHIRVNAVCPGYIDTPLWDAWLASTSNPSAVAAQTAAFHPLGRRGIPADVASAVLYLASPVSAWVTGTHLVVDGGLTIRAHP